MVFTVAQYSENRFEMGSKNRQKIPQVFMQRVQKTASNNREVRKIESSKNRVSTVPFFAGNRSPFWTSKSVTCSALSMAWGLNPNSASGDVELYRGDTSVGGS